MSPAVAAFVDVLLRGAALCGQAVAVGGVVFALWVLRGDDRPLPDLRRRALAVLAGAGIVVAAAQLLLLALQLSILADSGPWPVREAWATPYFRVGGLRALLGAGLAAAAWPAAAVRRSPRAPGSLLGLLALALTACSAWISHASARLEHREALLLLDGVHQLGASVWLGGLVHLTAAALGRGTSAWPPPVLVRFSWTALGAVAALLAGGAGMSLLYIDGVAGLLGTAYGMMVATKILLLAALLALGAVNALTVRRLDVRAPGPPARLRWFVEVEVGLGLTVLFAAAALTSLPPAVDVVDDRATLAEVATRFTPRWPTLRSPALAEVPVDDREAPRTDIDRAWSEYNHHVAGLFVLAMGLLATAHALGGMRWARHWPLLFLGLAVFIVLRADPEAWPLGPLGFWESMQYPEVLQHRLFALLVVLFGVFEWLVRTERLRRPGHAFVFPLLCSVGGALLLTHSHALLDLKSEFLIEITHVPIGLLALVVGWGRWLELRLPSPENRWPRRIWAAGLGAAGLLLLIYRES